MTDYSTYIFDLDGTLLDTLTDLSASVNYALAHHQLPGRSVEEVRCFVGNGIRKLIERAVPAGTAPEQTDAVFNTFREHYLVHSLDTTRPYPGICDVLAELRRRGKHIAVVSNKYWAATEDLCQHFFPDTVEVAIGENEAAGIRRKPAPDTVLSALKRLGADRSGAVYVGDSDVDIETARNAGLPVVSVLWGFRDRDFLLRAGATTLIERPEQLL